jgi:hypothetical protein
MNKNKPKSPLAVSRESLKVLDPAALRRIDGARVPETRGSDCDAECRGSIGAC